MLISGPDCFYVRYLASTLCRRSFWLVTTFNSRNLFLYVTICCPNPLSILIWSNGVKIVDAYLSNTSFCCTKYFWCPLIEVSSIPWCIIGGGGYYGDINVSKSLTISIRTAEASLRCSYGDGDGDTTPYEAGETLKLQNPSCYFLHLFLPVFDIYHWSVERKRFIWY